VQICHFACFGNESESLSRVAIITFLDVCAVQMRYLRICEILGSIRSSLSSASSVSPFTDAGLRLQFWGLLTVYCFSPSLTSERVQRGERSSREGREGLSSVR